jgi:uncharacterized membrane protein YdjX (TVP38/TMEM64 family)
VTSTAICALAAGLLLRMGAREQVLRLLEWIGELGAKGPLVFIGVELVVVVFLLPGVLFTLGAGFLFGPVFGTLCVVVGHTVGGAVAFLLARTLLSRQASGLLRKHQALARLDKRISEKGWKIIMLTRMIPLFPFKLSNYCFGVMRFTLRDFVIGTAVGVIPMTLTVVYAGSLAGDVAAMDSLAERGWVSWTIYGIGLVALAALVMVLAGSARRKLNLEEDS